MSGTGSEELLAAGERVLHEGDWPAARDAFEAALGLGESPEARFGLGNALWWLGETEPSVRALERAYAGFRRGGQHAQAALAAVHLCLTYRASLGNAAASRGWLARAARVVEERGFPGLAGWVLLCRAVTAQYDGDPRSAEGWGRAALDAARRTGDAGLELCALSEIGAALVAMGRVDDGVALLDEAMAGALGGEVESPDTVVLTTCNTIVSCSRAGDLARARQWVAAADGFNRRFGSPHLYAVCRIHYGGILVAAGRWEEAEAELAAALETCRAAEPGLRAEALARLAELRLAQGRPDEAARLLEGLEGHPAAVPAIAALHLARGEPAAAAALAERRLRELGDACLEGGILVELWVEAEAMRSPRRAVGERARELVDLVAGPDCPALVARAERALGRALLADGDPGGARPHIEAALRELAGLEMPLESARTRLLLAHALGADEREAAVAEARRALDGFEEVGARRDAGRAAALLRSLGVPAARRGPRGLGLLTRREREVLELLGEGLSNPEIAERLVLSRKTVEHHVARVLAKLRLRGRGEATAYALRHLPGRDSSTG